MEKRLVEEGGVGDFQRKTLQMGRLLEAVVGGEGVREDLRDVVEDLQMKTLAELGWCDQLLHRYCCCRMIGQSPRSYCFG